MHYHKNEPQMFSRLLCLSQYGKVDALPSPYVILPIVRWFSLTGQQGSFDSKGLVLHVVILKRRVSSGILLRGSFAALSTFGIFSPSFSSVLSLY
uniref:Uncharacterized protein n=1 Tax=Manihot esculenta TaxID=3983 RepID=A0A2C9UHL2_MANES